jgi:hypothetical protein
MYSNARPSDEQCGDRVGDEVAKAASTAARRDLNPVSEGGHRKTRQMNC